MVTLWPVNLTQDIIQMYLCCKCFNVFIWLHTEISWCNIFPKFHESASFEIAYSYSARDVWKFGIPETFLG